MGISSDWLEHEVCVMKHRVGTGGWGRADGGGACLSGQGVQQAVEPERV